jgi:hypothetical protein
MLTELQIADPPGAWEALGFSVDGDAGLLLDGVRIALGGPGTGIMAWALDGIPPTDDIDGLTTREAAPSPPPFPAHPNGASGIDHVVVVTPDFDRTSAALSDAGIPLRRVRDAGGFRQGFRRVGPAILELVEALRMEDGPARFWGLTLIVDDLDALAIRLGDQLRPIKDAVQPGRRIATLERGAGLSPHVAFMTPEIT